MDIVLQVRNFLHFDSLVTASFLSICLTRKKKKINTKKNRNGDDIESNNAGSLLPTVQTHGVHYSHALWH